MRFLDLHLELLPGGDGQGLRIDVGGGPFGEDREVVVCRPRLGLESEMAPGLLLELLEPRCPRADQRRGDLGVQLYEEGLALRAGDVPAEAALGVHGVRLHRDDDAVAAAGRAAVGEDLAWSVRDVLARHLDETEG